MTSRGEVHPGDHDGLIARPRRSLKRRILIGLSCAIATCAVLAAILFPMVQDARRVAVRLTDK